MTFRGLNRSPSQRQAAHTLVLNLALFLVGFKVLDLLLPYAFLVGISVAEVKSHYAIAPADVLILGDSHTSSALDPALFAHAHLSALNYSRGGHYAEFNEAFYAKYRQRYPPPKAVIISTPYFMFRNGSEANALIALLDWTDITTYYLRHQALLAPNFYQYGALFQESPLYVMRWLSGDRNALITYGYAADLDANFRTKDLTTVPPAVKTATPIEYARDSYAKDVWGNQGNLAAFQRLLAQLAADQVTVLLVETPEYQGTQDFVHGKAQFYQEIEAEVQAYPNVTFLPQSALPVLDPQDKTLFSDGGYGNGNSHLSYKGSQLYTEAVLQVVKRQLEALAAQGAKG